MKNKLTDKQKQIAKYLLVFLVVFTVILAVVVKVKEHKSNIRLETEGEIKKTIKEIYKKVEVELPDLETTKIDKNDKYALESFTGLKSAEDVKFVIVSEPLMSSQSYSLVIVKLNNNLNIEKVKQQMYDNIKMNKWICVSAEKLYITNYGNAIFLVMSSNENATAVYNAFKEYTKNGIGKTLTKEEAFSNNEGFLVQ